MVTLHNEGHNISVLMEANSQYLFCCITENSQKYFSQLSNSQSLENVECSRKCISRKCMV